MCYFWHSFRIRQQPHINYTHHVPVGSVTERNYNREINKSYFTPNNKHENIHTHMTTTPDNDPFTLAASPFYCVIFLSEPNYLFIYLYECSWRIVYGILSSAGTYMPIERNVLERTALFSRNFETTHSGSISQKIGQNLRYCSNYTKFGMKRLSYLIAWIPRKH